MDKIENISERVMQMAKATEAVQGKTHRFDIFKGVEDSTGRVQKIRSVGSAFLREGSHTAFVFLFPLIGAQYFLLPERKRETDADYVLLTRELSQQPGRKYFWRVVGEGRALSGQNSDLLSLSFDVFGADDIFMKLSSFDGKRLSLLISESASSGLPSAA